MFRGCSWFYRRSILDVWQKIYGLLNKRDSKMAESLLAEYWPSSVFACLWTGTESRSINKWAKKHSCPILSNRFHPTKQHSICCRSENCISLARSGQSSVDSIDWFNLSNGKVYYQFNKCGRRPDNCISLVTTATRFKIVESIDSFDWWEWLFHSQFHIKLCRIGGYTWMTTNKCTFLFLKTQKGVEQLVAPTDKRWQKND